MKRKIIIGIVIGIACIVVGAVGLTFLLERESDDKKEVESKSEEKEVANEFIIDIEKQYKDTLYRYFHYDTLYINEYDNLDRFPAAYEDTMVQFMATVQKVLEDDGKNYTILVSMQDDDYFWIEDEDMKKPNEIVIKGQYENAKRYIVGDFITVYGFYRGFDEYTIKGEDKLLPRVMADKILIKGPTDAQLFSIDEVRNVAQYFFNTKNLTVVEPNYNYDDPAEAELMGLPYHYIVTLDNNTNARFNKYRFFTDFGLIQVATEEYNGKLTRNIDKTSDEKNFILTNYTTDDRRLEFQVYNDKFEVIWSREFEEVDNYKYSNNNGRIVLNVNADTYIINEVDGTDIIKPFMTGEAMLIRVLRNGDFVLVSKKKTDFMMFVDRTGKIQWKKGISYEPQSIYALIIANDKVYVNYGIEETDRMVVNVYDKTGEEILNTFED